MTEFVKLDDGSLMALEDKGHGRPVVLVHGFPLDGSMWQAQVEALADEYRLLVPDLRGFGQSSVTSGCVTMARFADDLAEMLDRRQISQPIVLAGLSMGGYIALEFVRRHAERLAALILANTRAEADSPEVARGREISAQSVLSEGCAALAQTMAERLFSETTRRQKPELVAHWRQRMAAQRPAGVAAALYGMAERADMTEQLSQISCPVLLVAGSDDRITPADGMRAMATRLQDARWAEIAQAGHLTPCERPEEVSAAMVEFLRSL